LSAQRLQRRLDQTIKGPDGELLKECTQTIITHTDELKELVNEFSNFARLPEIHSSFNQLNEVCSEVLSLYIQAHPQIEFKLMTEPKLPGFYFDRDQIKRVLINLLENAIAAVSGIERPKKIQILTHYHEELGLGVFEVQDNGKGMPEEVKSRIFEPYFSTKSDGTGLGLAIAKRIVNDHQGVIRAQSLDTGTQFWIEIPIKK
jgi:two-component system nitrogen regulation sensor histidine kinase NtrY